MYTSELGRLTQDVSLNTVKVGGEEKSVCNNRIAFTNDQRTTSFINITAWGRTADFLAGHFKKGDELYLEGEIRDKVYRVGEKEIPIHYLLVTKILFTHGNGRGGG